MRSKSYEERNGDNTRHGGRNDEHTEQGTAMIDRNFAGLTRSSKPKLVHVEDNAPRADRWREVWLTIAPHLTLAALREIRAGLERDDERIMQGMTCSPPLYAIHGRLPIAATCPILFGIWQSGGCAFVSEAQDQFERLKDLAGDDMRYLLNWIDDTDRSEMREMLIAEVDAVIAERQ